MKKQKIQFIVILIVLAVLIAATFGMKWYNKNKEEEKTAEEEASTIIFPKWTLTRSQNLRMRSIT